MRKAKNKFEINGLKMDFTYAGLLMGYPTREMNEKIIESSLKEFPWKFIKKPFVISPHATPITENDFKLNKLHMRKPKSKAQIFEKVPEVACSAVFNVLGQLEHFGCIWFQESFEWPNREILRSLHDMDLTEHVEEFLY